MRCGSPIPGGSTLITSAPKSDSTVAAPGPARKLAMSTTFRPEKMLSSAIASPRSLSVLELQDEAADLMASSALKLWSTLCQKCRCAFFLVFRPGADRKQRGFQHQAFRDAGFQPLVHSLDGELDA